jgi:hypothetical protein
MNDTTIMPKQTSTATIIIGMLVFVTISAFFVYSSIMWVTNTVDPHVNIADNTKAWITENGKAANSITITRFTNPCCESTPYGVWFITNNSSTEKVIWVNQNSLKPINSNGNKESLESI